jgi:hypothetical protein
MNGQQIVIKVILVVVFFAFTAFLVHPGGSVRHAAVRRLVLSAAFVLAALAIVFPGVLNALAHVLGIGRGADLLLYGLIVVFAGNALVQQRRIRVVQRELTVLARRQAINEVERPTGFSD